MNKKLNHESIKFVTNEKIEKVLKFSIQLYPAI